MSSLASILSEKANVPVVDLTPDSDPPSESEDEELDGKSNTHPTKGLAQASAAPPAAAAVAPAPGGKKPDPLATKYQQILGPRWQVVSATNNTTSVLLDSSSAANHSSSSSSSGYGSGESSSSSSSGSIYGDASTDVHPPIVLRFVRADSPHPQQQLSAFEAADAAAKVAMSVPAVAAAAAAPAAAAPVFATPEVPMPRWDPLRNQWIRHNQAIQLPQRPLDYSNSNKVYRRTHLVYNTTAPLAIRREKERLYKQAKEGLCAIIKNIGDMFPAACSRRKTQYFDYVKALEDNLDILIFQSLHMPSLLHQAEQNFPQ